MRKFFQSGYAFHGVAALFILLSLVTERPAVYIAVGVVFFILGLAVGKKNAAKPSENQPGS